MENKKDTNPKDAIAGDKVPLDLMPDTAIAACNMAFLEGALKYGRYNWRVAGARASVYVSALRRHMAAWYAGEDIDEASKLPHLAKAMACLAILIDTRACGVLVDDRPPKADMKAVFTQLETAVSWLKNEHKDKNPKQYTIEDSTGKQIGGV